MSMAIEKQGGENFGMTVQIEYRGPERVITLMLTIAAGHGDPVKQPATHMFWKSIRVPASTGEVGAYTMDWNRFPGDLDLGKRYDVNIAVGEKKQEETVAVWYDARGDDDWDDEVYERVETPEDTSPTLKLVGEAEYF